MNLLHTIFILAVGLQFKYKPNFVLEQVKNTLLCTRNLTSVEITKFSIAQYNQHGRNYYRHTAILQQLLLMLSGSVETNPGPARIKFPCGECRLPVKNNQNSINCDNCQQWYHQKCTGMNNSIFDCYTTDERTLTGSVPNVECQT